MKIKLAITCILTIIIFASIKAQRQLIDTHTPEYSISTDTNQKGEITNILVIKGVVDSIQFYSRLDKPSKMGFDSKIRMERNFRIFKRESDFYRNNGQLDSIITYVYRKKTNYSSEHLSDTVEILKEHLFYDKNKNVIKKTLSSNIFGALGNLDFKYDNLNRVINKRIETKISGFDDQSYLYRLDIGSLGDRKAIDYSYLKNSNLPIKIVASNLDGEVQCKQELEYDSESRLIEDKTFSYSDNKWEFWYGDKIIYENGYKAQMIRTSTIMSEIYITGYDKQGNIISSETLPLSGNKY